MYTQRTIDGILRSLQHTDVPPSERLSEIALQIKHFNETKVAPFCELELGQLFRFAPGAAAMFQKVTDRSCLDIYDGLAAERLTRPFEEVFPAPHPSSVDGPWFVADIPYNRDVCGLLVNKFLGTHPSVASQASRTACPYVVHVWEQKPRKVQFYRLSTHGTWDYCEANVPGYIPDVSAADYIKLKYGDQWKDAIAWFVKG